MRELLIVGAGITGSLTAALLARARPSLSLTVWDKARGAGGRMSTHRDPANPALHVDMGAQYISRFAPRPTDTAAFTTLKEELYSELLKCRVLQPLSGKIEGERSNLAGAEEAKFVAPKGMNSVAKHFLEQSRATVAYQHQLQTTHVRDGRVFCDTSAGASANFDAVILTIPVPQILALNGNFVDHLDSGTRASLEAVKYSSRYALGLTLSSVSASSRSSFDWTMKYVDHPIIRFMSWDSSKRGSSEFETKSDCLLVHTGVPFATEHLETDKPRVQELVMAALTEVLPEVPWGAAKHSHLIRWRYSQVLTPYKDTRGFAELSASDQPLVLAAGDGFAGSNFENCLFSAQNTADHILKHLEPRFILLLNLR